MSRRSSFVPAATLVLLSLVWPQTAVRSAETTKQVEANRVAEFAFESSKAYANPFKDVQLDVVVTAADKSEHRHPAYWAGGRTWKFRYAASQPGQYRFRTECSDAGNAELHGVTGSIGVVAYSGDNLLYKHGPIRVAKDHRHLAYADGTPFFWLADTWWMALCDRMRWPQDIHTLAKDRREKGFNVIQIVVGPYPDMSPFDPRGKNEAGFPWTEDFSSIRPEYFDRADERLTYIADQGFVPCIVGAWAYHLQWMTEEQLKQHWRYLIARYGAMPVVWVAAGEVMMPYYLVEKEKKLEVGEHQSAVWSKILRYIHETDGFGRVVTMHPGAEKRSARLSITDPNDIDFEMLQMGHGRKLELIDKFAEHIARMYRDPPTMPVINGEFAYEGLDLRARNMFVITTEMTRKFAWVSILECGATGITYGANGIWQVNRTGAPYGPSPGGLTWGETPWDEAMRLPGSSQVAGIKGLLEPLDWQHFEPLPKSVSWPKGDTAETETIAGPYAMGSPAGTRVCYSLAPRPIVIQGLDPAKHYTCRYFDPVTLRESEGPQVAIDADGAWLCPTPETDHDWAVVLQPR